MSKIGLGVITCNRENFYKECYKSIPLDVIDTLVTVNDGEKLKGTYPKSHIITHKKNKGVGISKNEAMQHLLDEGCEHIFLIEDDIIVKDKTIFEKYIEASEITGLRHFMFGYHGPANKDQFKTPKPDLLVDYTPELRVAFNTHCVGALCYYHKTVLDDVGLMDEEYKNAWEHVDHSYCIVKKGWIPAYWYWPDIANSYDYLDELACSEEVEHGAIRNRSDWQQNIQTGAEHFIDKHGTYPGGPQGVPREPEASVVNKLKQIKEKYSCNEV